MVILLRRRPKPCFSWITALLAVGGVFLSVSPGAALGQAGALTASDISVLWPLKVSADPDTLFRKRGDGFCNAPSLSEGSIFPKDSFESFSALVLNGAGGACQRDKALEDEFFFSPDEDLMRRDVHVARLKGIAPSVCAYAAWKVVGMRYDPCMSTAAMGAAGGTCVPVVRLVAQPFEKQENGLWTVRDFTLHLIYKVDSSSFLADLKAAAGVARTVESKEAWEPEWDAKPNVLRPHHALRNEMESCGGTFSTALKGLVTKWAKREALFKVAWMTSSMGVKEWSFGVANPLAGGKSFVLTTSQEQTFDNFSDTLMQAGRPAMNVNVADAKFPNLSKQLALAALSALPAGEATNSARTANIDAVQRILDPFMVSQAQANCASCHLAPQILGRIRELYNTPNAVGSGEYAAPVWPGFSRDPRSFVQLRNFGYGPQFNLSINKRTINETDALLKTLRN